VRDDLATSDARGATRTEMDDRLRFSSRIDWWIPAIVAIAIAGAPLSIYFSPKTKPVAPSTWWLLAASLIVPIALLWWLFSTTEYVIVGNDLRVSGGPINIVVPLGSITKIARSSSLSSGATLSLYRLAIEYGTYKEVIISPADRQGFIRAIVARVPNVVLEDLDEYR
jgi:hypothetical protein